MGSLKNGQQNRCIHFFLFLVEEPLDSIILKKWMNFLLLCVDEASCQPSDSTPDTTNLNPQQSCTSGQRSSQVSASVSVTHNTSGWLLYLTAKQLKRSRFPSLLTVSASWSWTTEAEFRGRGRLQVVPVYWWWGPRRCVCSPQTGLCSLPAEEISKTLRTCLQRLLFVLPPPGETCQTLKMLTITLSNNFFSTMLQPPAHSNHMLWALYRSPLHSGQKVFLHLRHATSNNNASDCDIKWRDQVEIL